MRLLLMYDAQVGSAIVDWLTKHYLSDLGAIVAMSNDSIPVDAQKMEIPSFVYESDEQILKELSSLPPFDLGILAWWPKLISPAVISLAKQGFINTHPSLLPHNRGKHYNFWALVEQAPFGVSLHFVEQGIDSGDIVAQMPISYNWEDTGESLYFKARQAMVDLLQSTYPQIRKGRLQRTPQDLSKGSLHYASELDKASAIELDQKYTARGLLNLLRARTFSGYPACRFKEGGITYEVTVNIKKVN